MDIQFWGDYVARLLVLPFFLIPLYLLVSLFQKAARDPDIAYAAAMAVLWTAGTVFVAYSIASSVGWIY